MLTSSKATSKQTGGANHSTPSASEANAPNTRSLLEQSRLTTEEWFKSARTTKQYASYVKAGKKWLETLVQESNSSEEASNMQGQEAERGGQSESSTQEDSNEHAVFAGAFDTLGEHTPTVLRLYIAYKCEHQGLGFSTAEGIRSAFKNYFEMYDFYTWLFLHFMKMSCLYILTGFFAVKAKAGSSTLILKNGMEIPFLSISSRLISSH